MQPPITDRPTSKDVGEWDPPGKGPNSKPEVRMAYGFTHLHTLLYRRDGITLQELRISWIGDIWRMMLKGIRGRRHIVAYFYADEWRDLLMVAVTSVDSGYASWDLDDHPPYQYVATSDHPTRSPRPTF